MRFIKRILERGTITVPRDVREALGVDEGDIVEFEIVTIVRKSEEDPMTRNKSASIPIHYVPTREKATVSGEVSQ